MTVAEGRLPRNRPDGLAHIGDDETCLFEELTNGALGVTLVVVYSPARSDPADDRYREERRLRLHQQQTLLLVKQEDARHPAMEWSSH